MDASLACFDHRQLHNQTFRFICKQARTGDLSVRVWSEPRYQSGYVRPYDPEISPAQ